MFQRRAIDFFKQNYQYQAWEECFQIVDLSCSRDFQNFIFYWCCPCFPCFKRWVPFVEDALYSGCKIMRLKIDLNIKSPPWGLVLMLSVGNMQIYKGESQETVLPSYDTNEPQQWSALHHNLRLQEWHAYLGFNQQLLIGLKTSTRGKSHLVLET